MTDRIVRWGGVAAALALVLLLGWQWRLVGDVRTTVAEKLSEAQKLIHQADANNPLPPLKDPEQHSACVLEAWETLPTDVKPLNPWNFYPNPIPARTEPAPAGAEPVPE